MIWSGPIRNWIKACDYILGLDVDIIVPGHGPIAEKPAVRELKAYFEYIAAEARRHFDNDVPYEIAAQKISLDRFASWLDPERMVINVAVLVSRVFRIEGAARPHGDVRGNEAISGRMRAWPHNARVKGNADIINPETKIEVGSRRCC